MKLGKMIKALKDKAAYEKESYAMGREHLREVKRQSPELYEKGWWRK